MKKALHFLAIPIALASIFSILLTATVSETAEAYFECPAGQKAAISYWGGKAECRQVREDASCAGGFRISEMLDTTCARLATQPTISCRAGAQIAAIVDGKEECVATGGVNLEESQKMCSPNQIRTSVIRNNQQTFICADLAASVHQGISGPNQNASPQLDPAPLIAAACNGVVGSQITGENRQEHNECLEAARKQFEQCSGSAQSENVDQVRNMVAQCMNNWRQSTYPSAGSNIDALNQAAADGVKPPDQNSGDAADEEENEEDEKTCANQAENVGWWMCPLTSAGLKTADFLWTGFEQKLIVKPIEAGGSPAHQVWQTLRGIANGLLAVFFLFIIISQVSNLGISNYGIKKMLPRLLVAAVLINASFLLVQIAVDLSNALTKGIVDLLEGSIPGNTGSEGVHQIFEVIVLAGSVGVIAAGVAVAAGTVGFLPALMFLLVLLIPALLALVAGLVTLLIRDAVMPIFAALAPIAFAANVLPGTQKFFQKVMSFFTAMWSAGPVAALIYMFAKLAAMIIINDGGADPFAKIIAYMMLFISVIIAAIIPFKINPALKTIFNAANKGLNKLSAPVTKRARAGAGNYAKRGYARNLNKDVKPIEGRNRFTRGIKHAGRALVRPDIASRAAIQGVDKMGRNTALETALDEKAREQSFREGILLDSDRMKDMQGTAAGKSYISGIEKEAIENRVNDFRGKSNEEIEQKLAEAVNNNDHIGMQAWVTYQATEGGDPGLTELAKFAGGAEVAKGSKNDTAVTAALRNMKQADEKQYNDFMQHYRTNIQDRNSSVMSKDHRIKEYALNNNNASFSEATRSANTKIAENGFTSGKLSPLGSNAINSLLTAEPVRTSDGSMVRPIERISTDSLRSVGDQSTIIGQNTNDVARSIISSELSRRESAPATPTPAPAAPQVTVQNTPPPAQAAPNVTVQGGGKQSSTPTPNVTVQGTSATQSPAPNVNVKPNITVQGVPQGPVNIYSQAGSNPSWNSAASSNPVSTPTAASGNPFVRNNNQPINPKQSLSQQASSSRNSYTPPQAPKK